MEAVTVKNVGTGPSFATTVIIEVGHFPEPASQDVGPLLIDESALIVPNFQRANVKDGSVMLVKSRYTNAYGVKVQQTTEFQLARGNWGYVRDSLDIT